MIRAVLDTNALGSGFRSRSSPPGLILAAWERGDFILLTAEVILDELARTLQKPYFRRFLQAEEIEGAFRQLRTNAEMVQPHVQVQGVASHPEDDRILSIAVSARADYLVTGDRGLQALHSYEGVSIVSPREFLNILEG